MSNEKKSFFEKIIKNSEDGSDKKEIYAGETAERAYKKNDEEGQLAVDVYETSAAIVVISIIGGVKVEDVNISVANDVLTLKGVRERIDEAQENNYFVSECFWGPFSRSIILPVEVDTDGVKATMKNGILKVVLPKLTGAKTKKIKIEEE